MPSPRSRWIVAAAMAMACQAAFAQEETAPPDKSGFTLFNPTPRQFMRELSPDRPDTTESPFTVDAGHLQVEASFFSYAQDKEKGERTTSWTAFDTNVKLGLTNNMDIQFVFGAYGEEKTRVPGGPDERLDGFSDLTIRWKINLWGNDGGTNTIFGIMPYVAIPTGTELSIDEPEGGLIAILGFDLAEGIGAAIMGEIDAVYDADEDDYDTEFLHTATAGFGLVGPLGMYVEYIGIVGFDTDTDYQALFSTGLVYTISEDLLLDIGTRIGLTDAAEDLAIFTGFTFRY